MPRKATAPVVQTPPARPHCRRCHRPLDGRAVYCGPACIEAEDATAARLVQVLATARADLNARRAAVEGDLLRQAAILRRSLHGAEDNVTRMTEQAARLSANLAAAKAAGEVRWLASEQAPATGAQAFA